MQAHLPIARRQASLSDAITLRREPCGLFHRRKRRRPRHLFWTPQMPAVGFKLAWIETPLCRARARSPKIVNEGAEKVMANAARHNPLKMGFKLAVGRLWGVWSKASSLCHVVGNFHSVFSERGRLSLCPSSSSGSFPQGLTVDKLLQYFLAGLGSHSLDPLCS